MKKGTIIILAVAIIGALGIYGKSKTSTTDQQSLSGSSQNVNPASQVMASNTSDSSTSGGSATYKDGNFAGATEQTPYGPIQVAVVISGGKITDVSFLQMPSDRGHSQEVTSYSEPLLKDMTLQRQSAHIDFVSGATSTSEGYEQSLQAALNQAA